MHIHLNAIGFQHEKNDHFLFQDLDCRIQGPGFNVLFGPSGVGKTTLARIIAGEIRPFEGRVGMQDISKILYTYNTERLPNWSSVRQHLAAVTPESRKGLLGEIVEIFGLDPVADSRFSRLSLGQQNRANLAR